MSEEVGNQGGLWENPQLHAAFQNYIFSLRAIC